MSGPLSARLHRVRAALARLRALARPAFPLVGLATAALLAVAGRRWS